MNPRQEKSALSLTFLNRTDSLASRLRIGVKQLAQILEISTGTLFAGRRSDHAVTSKTWHKLEQAEAAAGIGSNISPISADSLDHGAESESDVNNLKRDGLKKTAFDDHASRIAALEDAVRLLNRAVVSLLPGYQPDLTTAKEPKSRRAEEPKSRRAEEPKSRRAEEPKLKTMSVQRQKKNAMTATGSCTTGNAEESICE